MAGLKELEINKDLFNKLVHPSMKYTDEIGVFLVQELMDGSALQWAVDKWNDQNKDNKITRVAVYRWLKSDKLKHFSDAVSYARQQQGQSILDDIQSLEVQILGRDLPDGVLPVDSKSGRVVLESMRWRAKAQDQDRFGQRINIKEKSERTFIIKSSIPEPGRLPGEVGEAEDDTDRVKDQVKRACSSEL
jgi:hypothetical protein